MSGPALTVRGGIAAIAITLRGAETARRLQANMPDLTAHVPARFATGARPDAVAYSEPARALIARLFHANQGLILVMAAGAAVRMISPLLHDKYTDPAVVVVDDSGRFAISLLSGHTGGGNRLTQRVAAALGASAVITTASEAAGIPPADLLGGEYGWRIEPGSALKMVAAALVNGDKVGIIQECGDTDWQRALPPAAACYPDLATLLTADPAAVIVVSDRQIVLPESTKQRAAIYHPPTLVLGIGCSRGAAAEEIAGLVNATLASHRLSPLSVAAIASIDQKVDEPGLCDFARDRGLPLITYPATVLEQVEGDWSRSEIVQSAVGVGGVAEPAALACAGTSSLLVRKVKTTHVTLAIARRN